MPLYCRCLRSDQNQTPGLTQEPSKHRKQDVTLKACLRCCSTSFSWTPCLRALSQAFCVTPCLRRCSSLLRDTLPPFVPQAFSVTPCLRCSIGPFSAISLQKPCIDYVLVYVSPSPSSHVAIPPQAPASAVTVRLAMTKRKSSGGESSGASHPLGPHAKQSCASCRGASQPTPSATKQSRTSSLKVQAHSTGASQYGEAAAKQKRAPSQRVEANNSGAPQPAAGGTQNDSLMHTIRNLERLPEETRTAPQDRRKCLMRLRDAPRDTDEPWGSEENGNDSESSHYSSDSIWYDRKTGVHLW